MSGTAPLDVIKHSESVLGYPVIAQLGLLQPFGQHTCHTAMCRAPLGSAAKAAGRRKSSSKLEAEVIELVSDDDADDNNNKSSDPSPRPKVCLGTA